MIESTGPKISSWAIVMSLRHVGEHRRAHEVALVEPFGRLGAAGQELGSLVDALLDVAADAVALHRGDERPEAGSSGSKGLPGVKPSAAALAFSSTSASRERGTSIRVRAEQVCPELR